MDQSRATPGNQASLREANRSRLVAAVKRHGALTQVELAGATGLSPATVSNIVRELSGSGVLHTAPSTRSGRRAQRVSLARGLGLAVGVHVGQRHLRVALSDLGSTVVADRHMPLARDHRADAELDKAAMLVADLLDSVESGLDDVVGVGVAISAPVDPSTGLVSRRGILRGWNDLPIAETLEARLRRPVRVDNASNLAALAELRSGAARGKQDVVVLDVGDGIGAGIIVGGRLLRGHRGGAGEFGHIVVDPGGPVCRCGNRGCLEAVADAAAVLDGLGESGRTLKVTDLVLRAAAGEARFVRAVADAGRVIGRAAASLCNLLDPERVVVGGDLARAGELLLGPMRHALEASVLLEPAGHLDLVQSHLDVRAPVLGALALAIEHASVTEPVAQDVRAG